MSSASSAVNYTFVYTDSESGRVFCGADEELSDGGSPRVIVYVYDGLPMLPIAPPSPDYIPGPEEPHTPPAPQDEDEHELMFIQLHYPDFVPEPIYPEYIPLEDEYILLAEEQPLPPVVSPTAESPGYIAESDLEEDPKECEEDETEDGPVDYPMDGGDDGHDDDDDSSGYDADDEDEYEEDEEEEEQHLAPANSAVVIPIIELASPPEGTKPIIPPPFTDTATTGAKITIQPQTFISLPPEAEVERLLSMPTPPPSPLTLLSPPFAGERLARCMAPATLPLHLLPPSLYQPPVDRRDDILKSEQPPRKRLCLSTLGSMYEVGESFTRGLGVDSRFADTIEAEMRHRVIGKVGYGIRDTWIDPAEGVPEMVPTTLEKVNTRVTELAELHEHDTQDLYALLEDAQDGKTRISQRVAMDSQRVDLLMGDKMSLQEQIIAPVTRQEQNSPPPNTDTAPHHLTPESVQAMIDQALLRNSTNGDGSQSSHRDNLRNVQTTRPCFYADFMKCHHLNFNGNEAKRADNKRKTDDTSRNIHGHQQQPFKKQNVTKVYNMGTGERKPYEGSLPKSSGNVNVANAQRHDKETPKGNGCFECGASGNFKRDCPKLKNKNGGSRNAQGWVYAVGNVEENGNAPMNLDSNVVTGTFHLNNRYASILFDTGADRSFISITFSSLVNIDPTQLGCSYDVELADGKIVGIDTII
nr:putative reverse transcriptase domain-containing protein [Tanacetum cinerariifolium]